MASGRKGNRKERGFLLMIVVGCLMECGRRIKWMAKLPDGSSYEEEMKRGNREGMGNFKYADGASYTEEWKNDKREGTGVLVFPDGAVYEGGWENDLIHGKGALKTPYRTRTGEWNRGIYMS